MGKKGRRKARDMKYAMGVDLARGADRSATVFYRRMPDGTMVQIGDRIDVAIDVVEDLARRVSPEAEAIIREDVRDLAGRQEP